MSGEVAGIYITEREGGEIRGVDEIKAVAGRGLEGDRYFHIAEAAGEIEPKREVTLIETEAIEAAARDHALELEPGASRRNIETRGVPLNHLVGREFTVGDARLLGIKLAEPCSYLAKQVGDKKVIKALIHRGGLRAQILESGTIRVGDPIEI